MHVSNMKLFAVLIPMFVSGCYLSHERGLPPVEAEDSGRPVIADSGSVVVRPDAGTMPMADSGSVVVMTDAGSDAGPPPVEIVVDPLFGSSEVAAGANDAQANQIRVSVHGGDVEWFGGLAVQIRGLGANCNVRGSGGTEYFTDIKIKDLGTGATWMGPNSMPSLELHAQETGFFRVGEGDDRGMAAGSAVELGITMDVSSVEDGRGELVDCTFAVYVGVTDGSILEPTAVRDMDGRTLRPDQISGDNAAAHSTFTVHAP